MNPGSVTGARPRDSHTCATLDLPGCVARFYNLDDGAEREIAPIVVGSASEAIDL